MVFFGGISSTKKTVGKYHPTHTHTHLLDLFWFFTFLPWDSLQITIFTPTHLGASFFGTNFFPKPHPFRVPPENPSCETLRTQLELQQHKADLHVGSKAQIVGLQRAIELNGLQVLVLEEEEGEGTWRQREEVYECQVEGEGRSVICMKKPPGFGGVWVYIRGWNHTQNENNSLVVQGIFGGVYYPVI